MKSQIVLVPKAERFQNKSRKKPREEELKFSGVGETVPWAKELIIVETPSMFYSLCFCISLEIFHNKNFALVHFNMAAGAPTRVVVPGRVALMEGTEEAGKKGMIPAGTPLDYFNISYPKPPSIFPPPLAFTSRAYCTQQLGPRRQKMSWKKGNCVGWVPWKGLYPWHQPEEL